MLSRSRGLACSARDEKVSFGSVRADRTKKAQYQTRSDSRDPSPSEATRSNWSKEQRSRRKILALERENRSCEILSRLRDARSLQTSKAALALERLSSAQALGRRDVSRDRQCFASFLLSKTPSSSVSSRVRPFGGCAGRSRLFLGVRCAEIVRIVWFLTSRGPSVIRDFGNKAKLADFGHRCGD